MKTCSRCNTEKDDSEFRTQYYKERAYLRSYCKTCDNVYATEQRRKRGIKRKPPRKLVSIPDEKVCSKCNEKKNKNDFRVRADKRSDPPFIYLNNTCKKCDAELHLERFRKERNTPEGKARHNRWAREFHHRHREKCLAAAKERRNRPGYKEMISEYRNRNRDKLNKKSVITKRRWSQKHMENLTDEYISMKLFNCIDREFIKNHPELIEAKRLQILIKRKMQNNVKN